jgi:catechol 2,3-dioxygenase-like lactoylglutathione lyase family enzyme
VSIPASGPAIVEVALFTDDVPGLRDVYAQLLQSSPEAEWPGGAVFAVSGAKILVHQCRVAMDDGPPNEDHFALGVADLDRACDQLRESGATFLVEPRDYPWGRSAYLRDPDGRLVELAQLQR